MNAVTALEVDRCRVDVEEPRTFNILSIQFCRFCYSLLLLIDSAPLRWNLFFQSFHNRVKGLHRLQCYH